MNVLVLQFLSSVVLSSPAVRSAPKAYELRGHKMHDLQPGHVGLYWHHQRSPLIVRLISLAPETYKRLVQDKKTILVAKISLENSTIISFYEKPHDIIGDYNSTVVIRRKGRIAGSFNVGKVLKSQAFSLGYIGMVRSGSGEPILICNYVGQPSEGPEGFVIIRPRSLHHSFFPLPVTEYGKLVISLKNVNQVQLWSALPAEMAGANSLTSYASQTCELENGEYRCSGSVIRNERHMPNSIIDPAIDIQP